ncbi:MAG: DUF3039 domain-containing protein [Acidimicrobiaceae bacterium]|nr:DUF3039 domain-containing protein [Acidimicrobiaceae bacterium]
MDILKTTDTISNTVGTDTDTATTTKQRPTVSLKPSTDDGDHDRFAHYIRKSHSMQAYVEGTSVRALCGKVWVPSRDPSRYPVCPICAEIWKGLPSKSNN